MITILVTTALALLATVLVAGFRMRPADTFPSWMNAEGLPVLIVSWFLSAALLSAFGHPLAHLLLRASRL